MINLEYLNNFNKLKIERKENGLYSLQVEMKDGSVGGNNFLTNIYIDIVADEKQLDE